MATNTKRGRKRRVLNRAQVKNPITKKWVKIDTTTGRIIDHKKTPGPFKGVRIYAPDLFTFV